MAPTLAAFRCHSLDPTISRMFTAGQTYPVHQAGPLLDDTGYVLDDLKRKRFISSDHRFIVENNSSFWSGEFDIRRAYFTPIYAP
jgi:hypothetical protein